MDAVQAIVTIASVMLLLVAWSHLAKLEGAGKSYAKDLEATANVLFGKLTAVERRLTAIEALVHPGCKENK